MRTWTSTRLLVAGALLLVVARGSLIVTSTATPDEHWSGIRNAQFLAAQDFCSGTWSPDDKVEFFLHNLRRYLPENAEFHGVLLVNNILTLGAGCALGIRSEVAEGLALVYTVAAFLFWGAFLLRHGGVPAYLMFCGLFIVPPPKLTTASLFLMGSHVEGAALCGAAFWLAFREDQPRMRYALFGAAGVLFFLHKPTVFPLMLLLPWMWLRLQTWRQRAVAAGLLSVGFVPMALFATVYGWRGDHLQDDGPDPALATDSITWWNALSSPSLRLAEAWRPVAEVFDSGVGGDLGGSLYLVVFAVAFVLLALRTVGGTWPAWLDDGSLSSGFRPSRWALLLIHPALHCGVLVLSRLPLCERYFLPLYPLTMVVVAMALASLPRRVGLTTFAALMGVLLAGNLIYLLRGPWVVLFD